MGRFGYDTEIVFKQDVECEVFRSEHSQRGKMQVIKKGEEADIFDLPVGSDYVGVQFIDGEVAFVNRKLIARKKK